MPNHIQCRLKFIGTEQEVLEMRNSISGEYDDKTPMQIDFNKIVPQPIGMNVQICSRVENMVKESLKMPVHENALIAMLERGNREKTPSPLTLNDEEWAQYVQCLSNVRATGHIYWYDWNIANWGTKWNAYGQNDKRSNDDTIYFQTAWSSPVGLIEELHKMFPKVELDLLYADEDTGSNCGHIGFKQGVKYEVIPESQSNEAYDIYFELNPDDRQYYEIVNGKYSYIESDN